MYRRCDISAARLGGTGEGMGKLAFQRDTSSF
jgi:hypothetical protein